MKVGTEGGLSTSLASEAEGVMMKAMFTLLIAAPYTKGGVFLGVSWVSFCSVLVFWGFFSLYSVLLRISNPWLRERHLIATFQSLEDPATAFKLWTTVTTSLQYSLSSSRWLSCYDADTEEDEALRLLRWQIAFVSGFKCNTVQSARPSGM